MSHDVESDLKVLNVLFLNRTDTDCTVTIRPNKKRASGSHLLRLSIPSSKATLLQDKDLCLQKSHSVQNLASECKINLIMTVS